MGGDQTAYIAATSARKLDDLVKALGCDSGVSKSTMSRICAGIDADVHVLRTRRLDHQGFVYVWLDATYVMSARSRLPSKGRRLTGPDGSTVQPLQNDV